VAAQDVRGVVILSGVPGGMSVIVSVAVSNGRSTVALVGVPGGGSLVIIVTIPGEEPSVIAPVSDGRAVVVVVIVMSVVTLVVGTSAGKSVAAAAGSEDGVPVELIEISGSVGSPVSCATGAEPARATRRAAKVRLVKTRMLACQD
jgi:hypothetical protein